MQTKVLKKLGLLILVLALFFGLSHLPLVPEAQPYEEFTGEGGGYFVDYEFSSLYEMLGNTKNWDGFPHNQDTRRFNILSTFTASLLILGLCGFLGYKILKRK